MNDLFAALPVIDEAANVRLHARLLVTAEADGLLDVAYRTLDTPVGRLLLAATEVGLVRVAFEDPEEVLAA
ncbi:MAG: cysteine methyltransferase, partial [Jatrophihabitantaceae bacterium]